MEDAQSGLFQCGKCKKGYKRIDHLSRHVRSHTQSKPYKCHICPKSFTRTDLLKRHVAGHDSQHQKSTRANSRANGDDASRVAQACKACASSHLRCSDEKPCNRCVRKGVECDWDEPMEVDLNSNTSDTEEQQDDTYISEEPPTGAQMIAFTPVSLKQTLAAGSSLSFEAANQVTDVSQESTASIADIGTVGLSGPFFDEYPALNLLSAQWPDVEGMVLDPSIGSDFNDMDFFNLDSTGPQTGRPSDMVDDGSGALHAYPMSRRSSDPGQPAAMRAEAFRNSHWQFRPEPKDYAGADDHNLSLPPVSTTGQSPESHVAFKARVLGAELEVATRDKILTMVVKTANPISLPRAVRYFPSLNLFDALLQYYMSSSASQASYIFHAATFDPNQKRPEVLAAMAASGAVLTSEPMLVKLGYAVAELTRIAIAKLWDEDNTLVRDLELSQAFYLILEIGLWSGHGRRVEIAESFLQPLLTMLRRNGKFRLASYPTIPIGNAEGEELHDKWITWVEQESWKRLAYRLLLHDTNASVALLINPLISYTEVQLPLPGSRALWLARTPQAWRDAYQEQSNPRQLVVGELLDDPGHFNSKSESIDTYIASRAALAIVWRLAWELRHMMDFQSARPRRFNAFITASRLDELSKLLQSLQASLASEISRSPDLAVRFELIQLQLHMPFEDVQVFAGMQGSSQARAMLPTIKQWIKSESARKAIWHASQIIRASKLFGKGLIRGSEVISVYYASLALWAYGLLSGRQEGDTGFGQENSISSPQDVSENVYLDDTESLATRRFIEIGVGRPHIRSIPHDAAGFPGVYLGQPGGALEVIIATIESNFGGLELPYLTEKLIQLIAVLKKASW